MGPAWIFLRSSTVSALVISLPYKWFFGLADRILRTGRVGLALNVPLSHSTLFRGSYSAIGLMTKRASFFIGSTNSGSLISYSARPISNSRSLGTDTLGSFDSVASYFSSIPFSLIRCFRSSRRFSLSFSFYWFSRSILWSLKYPFYFWFLPFLWWWIYSYYICLRRVSWVSKKNPETIPSVAFGAA